METADDIKQLITTINELVESGKANEESHDFWADAGARILIFIENTAPKAEKVNAMTPRDYLEDDICVLSGIFTILRRLSSFANEPFDNKLWNERNGHTYEDTEGEEYSGREITTISFYELAISRCCAWICQLLGDRFNYIQKLLIKNIFDPCEVCSLFASDLYMFLQRIVHPNHKMSMCLLIMNMCRLAPPDAFVKGAALINRTKHSIVNFENPKYQHLLDFA